jgi:hypothetical protein
MAPRRPESRAEFIARLRHVAPSALPLLFGSPTLTHAVVVQQGRWRVRRLVSNRERERAHWQRYGRLLPEEAEMMAEPTGNVLLDASSVDELIQQLEHTPWPLPM